MDIANRHISIWGDSIMKGVILDEVEGRYRVLEENCVHEFGEKTGAVITNHASFGMTSSKAVERIARSVERNPPAPDDIVLVEYGGNDCDYNWEEVSANPDKHHLPKTPIERFGSTLQAIIDKFKSFKIQPVFMSLPPLEPNRYLDWISKNLSKENILKWLGDVNQIYRWQEAYNEIVVQTAKDNDLRIINVRKDFLISSNYSNKFCADGIHPNKFGHQTILDSCMNFVQSA